MVLIQSVLMLDKIYRVLLVIYLLLSLPLLVLLRIKSSPYVCVGSGVPFI